MSNIFKTGLLLAVLTAMLVLLGGAIGGQQGMMIAFFLALAMNFASYWFSDKIVLAAYGAQPIDEAAAPRLYAIVHRLATRDGQWRRAGVRRSEEHTSELQSPCNLVCRLLL